MALPEDGRSPTATYEVTTFAVTDERFFEDPWQCTEDMAVDLARGEGIWAGIEAEAGLSLERWTWSGLTGWLRGWP